MSTKNEFPFVRDAGNAAPTKINVIVAAASVESRSRGPMPRRWESLPAAITDWWSGLLDTTELMLYMRYRLRTGLRELSLKSEKRRSEYEVRYFELARL